MTLLALEALQLSFGGVAALAGVSLEVNAGDFFAIIGPNGAGKTSIFNCISGIYAPGRGHIRFDGHDITHLKSHQRAKLGIARTFQNIALFKGMTVLDNVKIGRHIHLRSGVLACGSTSAGRPAKSSSIGRPSSARSSTSSSFKTFATRSSAPCRMDCRSAWSWPGPWPSIPPCCSSTSRRRG